MMNSDSPSLTRKPTKPSQQRLMLILAVLAVLFITIPFMFWYDTWFGRQLSNQEITEYLQDVDHPRKIQHALSQIADRIAQSDVESKQWYPQIIALAKHPKTQIRNTVAWLMGQDNQSSDFHLALRQLLIDSQVMVRRNAALALARFGDASSRAVLIDMLQPYQIRAADRGEVSTQLKEDQQIGTNTLIARITQRAAEPIEVRSPFSGVVQQIVVEDGSLVRTGDVLVLMRPGVTQLLSALQGLYLVGETADLAEVERYTQTKTEIPDEIRQQAKLTAQAIRTRRKQ